VEHGPLNTTMDEMLVLKLWQKKTDKG